MIISNDVTEDTFVTIKDGFERSLYTDEFIKNRMVDDLSLHDRVNLTNLSYLMACGIVEIKFGCCQNGLFHSKSGYVIDAEGNELCLVGSNNETRQSIDSNYEKFHITTSWLSSEFDRSRIADAKNEFESLWNNKNQYVVVFDPPESFSRYMEKMNRGKLFKDEQEFTEGRFFLDYDGSRAYMRVPDDYDPHSIKFRIKVMSLVELIDGQSILFKSDLNRRSLRNILSKIDRYCTDHDLELIVSDQFSKITSVKSNIESLALLGRSIKHRNTLHNDEFELFKSIVDRSTDRKLRYEQMWDSFFLYKLSKAANFSVPGSGKTSTVLGMFAYLSSTDKVDRILMIGPLSSFDSWVREFKTEFEGIMEAKVFRSDLDHSDLEYDFRFDSGGSNLILFNYESFDRNISLLNLLSERIDDKTLLVFDEVHRIKNVEGKRAMKMLTLSKRAKYAVVMTGTPIPNGYTDAYNFLHILFDEDSYDEYFSLTPSQLSKMDSNQIELFNQKMYPFFCRTTKHALGVPPANKDSTIAVQASDYENKILELLKTKVMNPLTMIVRILQLESDPSMLNHNLMPWDYAMFEEDPSDIDGSGLNIEVTNKVSSKTMSCIELVTDLVNSGKKIILWCIFIKSMDNLDALLSERGIRASQIHGGTENREKVINSFRSGAIDVLITNPQTLAESVSLHDVCHDAVYFEYSYNLVHLLQSKDRIHRLGLPDNQYTQYYFLESEFLKDGRIVSLDRQIHDCLNMKEDIMFRAIENDEFEQFPNSKEEVEEILLDIGMMPSGTTNADSNK